jgi:hypothetical protein
MKQDVLWQQNQVMGTSITPVPTPEVTGLRGQKDEYEMMN